MATLAGTKVKESYGNLLQVNGGVDGTLSTVEDGNGNTSALKLSSTEVQLPSAGTEFTGTPPNNTSVVKMLMLNGSNEVVTRDFDFTLSDNISVDTGWRDMHTTADDGGTFYGINSALSRVQSRYAGREVKLKGELYVPLDIDGTSGTGAVATSETENRTANRSTLHTASGWTGADYKITTPVIFSADVAASFDDNMVEQQLTPFVPISRTIKTTSSDIDATYTTFVSLFITSDLKLEIRSRYAELGGSAATAEISKLVSPLNEILPKFDTGDGHFLDWTDRTNQQNSAAVAHANVTPQFNFNGRGEVDMANWGGLKLRLDGLSFMLDSTVGLEVIQSAGV
jgi:hypothetical protein